MLAATQPSQRQLLRRAAPAPTADAAAAAPAPAAVAPAAAALAPGAAAPAAAAAAEPAPGAAALTAWPIDIQIDPILELKSGSSEISLNLKKFQMIQISTPKVGPILISTPTNLLRASGIRATSPDFSGLP